MVTTYFHGLFLFPQLFNKLATVLDPDVCVISSSALPAPALGQVEEEEGGNYTEPSKAVVDRAKQKSPASIMHSLVQITN